MENKTQNASWRVLVTFFIIAMVVLFVRTPVFAETESTIDKDKWRTAWETAFNAGVKYVAPGTKTDFDKSAQDKMVISDSKSSTQTYAWVSGEYILYYSEAEKIYLPSDSSHLFEGGQRQIRTIDLSLCDTSKVTNMSYMFEKCNYLSDVTGMSNFNTSHVTNMSHMFDDCNSLNFTGFSDWDTSNVTDMSYMFSGVGNFNYNLAGLDTNSVVNMEGMFSYPYHNRKNENIDLSNFDTSHVTNMKSMFEGCTNLKSINADGMDTSRVTDMSSMFSSCEFVTRIDMSEWDTSNVTTFDDMFKECGSLEELDVSHFNTSKAKTINSMFSACSSLKELNCSRWNTSSITDMGEVFSMCESLECVDLSGWDTSNVTKMEYMFSDCYALVSILTTENWDINNVADDEGMFASSEKLPNYNSNKTDKSMAKLARDGGYFTLAFPTLDKDTWRSLLTNVTAISYSSSAPGTETEKVSIAAEGTGEAYAWREGETLYYYSPAGKIYLTGSAENLFSPLESYSNHQITSLDLSGFDTSRLTSMRRMFWYNVYITDLDLSGFGTSSVTDMSEMFYGCENLKSVNLSNFDMTKVTDIDSMFVKCTSIQQILVSEEWQLTEEAKQSVTYCVFDYCDNLPGYSLKNTGYKGLRLTSNGGYMTLNTAESSIDGTAKSGNISISGVEKGATINAYQLITGNYRTDNLALTKYTTTSLGAKATGKGDNDNEHRPIRLYSGKNEDGTAYESDFANVTDDNNGTYITGSTKFFETWTISAANQATDEDKYTSRTVVVNGEEITLGKFTYEKTADAIDSFPETGTYSAMAEPGLYLVIVSGSPTGTIYNPVLLAVNVSDAMLDEDSDVYGSTVDMNTYFDSISTTYMKQSSTGFEKKIIGVTEGEADGKTFTTEFKESSNVDAIMIGDTVTFKLDSMTIPSYSDEYDRDHIQYEIYDMLDDGFSPPRDITVKVGTRNADGTFTAEETYTETENYKVYIIVTEHFKEFQVSFARDYIKNHGGKAVEITYNATLTEDADLNYDTNYNHAVLRYSSDPTDYTKVKTLTANTFHYTFGLDAELDGENSEKTHEINKVTTLSGEDNYVETEVVYSDDVHTYHSNYPLSGAKFALFDDAACSTRTTYGNGATIEEAESDNYGHITFKGLDEGIYYMRETKAPLGYTIDASIYMIVIDAKFAEDGIMTSYTINIYKSEDGGKTFGDETIGSASYTNQKYEISDLQKNMTNTNTWYMGELYVFNTIGPAGATATEHMSIKPVEVLNQKNPLLPATGGEGRYTVYAIAAALGLACAAFSIAKSKKKKAA